VSDNLYVVFSKPPDGVSWDEYNRWYEHHARENIQTPGFKGVERYAVNPVVVGKGVGPSRASVDPGTIRYDHLAVFEFEGDIADVRADLNRRVQSGDIVLPKWFNDVPFSTWNCISIDGHVSPSR
jgi:hypothetical protein